MNSRLLVLKILVLQDVQEFQKKCLPLDYTVKEYFNIILI